MRVIGKRMCRLGSALRYSHVFSKVVTAPPDDVFGMVIAFANDSHTQKVNLGLGAYKNWELQPVVLDVVRKVEQQIAADQTLNMEYIPIDGLPGFVKGSQNLIFGRESSLLKQGRVATVQTLSGTGALRLGFQFIKQYLPSKVHISDPSWPNHQRIIEHSNLEFKCYHYYDPLAKKIALDRLLTYLQDAEEGNVVLFQICAHNPTATDPSQVEWKAIADVIQRKKLVAFFDSTYQGLGVADFDQDIWAVRHFAERGLPLFVEQSYAKNMGMYGHRVGCLHVVAPDQLTANKVLSQLKVLIRGNYSSPPLYGARIAEKILNSPTLLAEWQSQLKAMVARIDRSRQQLRSGLQSLKTPGSWQHLTKQTGFFAFSDINERQWRRLHDEYHIHMMNNGESSRMAMIGLNENNTDYVVRAIHETLTKEK